MSGKSWTDERGVSHHQPIAVTRYVRREARCGRCDGGTFWQGRAYDHDAILTAWGAHQQVCRGVSR